MFCETDGAPYGWIKVLAFARQLEGTRYVIVNFNAYFRVRCFLRNDSKLSVRLTFDKKSVTVDLVSQTVGFIFFENRSEIAKEYKIA